MTQQEKELVEKLIAFMDCPCCVFDSMNDDDPILAAYADAKERGKAEGFTPLLLSVEELLLEDMLFNCGAMEITAERRTEITLSFIQKSMPYIRQWRENLLREAEGENFIQQNMAWLDEDLQRIQASDWARKEASDLTASGELVEGFSAYWNSLTMATCPAILAEVPVREPWKAFVWLCIGGWNEFPPTKTIMALSQKWYKIYGAVPACARHDILEYSLDQPVSSREKASELAIEQYVFCTDRVAQAAEGETLGTLADTLTKSKVWYFWWD